MSSYVMYCRAQAGECARRAKLASSPEVAASHRSLGLPMAQTGRESAGDTLRPNEQAGVRCPGRPLLTSFFNAARLRNANDALARCGDDGILVGARAHAAVGEDAVVGDPFEGLLVDLLGVRLDHEALARTPAARVHHGVVTRGELVLVVVSVAIRAQVDVALRALERAEELAQVFGIGIAGHHGRDHERRVDHFAEAKLFGEV